MGRSRQFALVWLCATVTIAGWCAARLGGLEWSGIENTATSIWNRGATRGARISSADAAPVGTLLAHAVASMAAEAPAVEAPLSDSRPPPETRGRLVSLFRPEPVVEEDPQPAARPVETLDECLVVDICIDEYLWSLYERTPKVDTNKVTERVKTTVKVKGKTRTVTKTITNYVVADFTWKDPIAAQRVGMSLKDYVIGGMDRGFKRKLFRALRAIETPDSCRV